MSTKSNEWRPESFECGCRTFKIKYVTDYMRGLNDARGLCEYEHGTVTIATHLNGEKLPEDAIVESIGHEILHANLLAMDRGDLSSDEAFVSMLSNLSIRSLLSIK